MPALFMSGARSPLAARRVCEILARALPAARLVTLEDAGHMGPLTHGQTIADHILAHLALAETED
jgi:pimeloyl-ACP methyl ester carboxylesterase